MINVIYNDETFWLNQTTIAELFGVDRSVITKHISNIFKDGELDEKSNVQKMHIANSDKPVKFYNLNVILSVGYRVNSKEATKFRIWATNTLNHSKVIKVIFLFLKIKRKEKVKMENNEIEFCTCGRYDKVICWNR